MEALRFKGPAAYVADLDRSRAFYEDCLGLAVQRVMRRDGRPIAVAYTAGLSIWLADDAYQALYGGAISAPERLGTGNWENTFETPAFEAVYARLQTTGARFVYAIRELPWGQRGFRVHDPDGHILDISETHDTLVRRLLGQGMSREAVAEQVSLTLEQVDACKAPIPGSAGMFP